ncbi:MAG: SHOCT domain-containing protein [Anaerolineae bacterium]|nr:SHOCT domain-containing protein [Anaerolineae bacterium]
MMGGWGLLGGLFGLFLFLLVVAAVIVLVVWLVRRSASAGSSTAHGQAPTARDVAPTARDVAPTAREILAQRYARGEITREEYLSMRADLD